jgi:thiol-disulfide isomerase/thioredoxin
MSFRSRFVGCLLVLSLASVALAQAPANTTGPAGAGASPSPGYASNPKFQAALKEAKEFEAHKQLGFAGDAYKKANKIAGGQCVECLRPLFSSQMASGSYKDAIATASAMEALLTTPATKATAEFLRGEAMLAQAGDKPKPAQLEAVDAVLKQAIANSPKGAAIHYLDGETLAKMGKMEEAKVEFETCVSCASPTDPARLRAQHFAANPELSTKKMAPAFVVTALDGSKFNLDAMGGRVVLIDFWATWCGPCNEELPHMKKIAKEFAGQPLVIISVSWDQDEVKWKDFVAKNEMTWVQYRDADHALTNSFGISAIPHYFTIDSDGILTSEMLGEGSDVEGKLKKLVAKAREAQAATTVAQAAGN